MLIRNAVVVSSEIKKARLSTDKKATKLNTHCCKNKFNIKYNYETCEKARFFYKRTWNTITCKKFDFLLKVPNELSQSNSNVSKFGYDKISLLIDYKYNNNYVIINIENKQNYLHLYH